MDLARTGKILDRMLNGKAVLLPMTRAASESGGVCRLRIIIPGSRLCVGLEDDILVKCWGWTSPGVAKVALVALVWRMYSLSLY